MKNLFFSFLVLGTAVLSCRQDTEELQRIDQVVHLYIDSLGQDMLNSKIPGSYFSVTMNDVDGQTDNAPVAVSLRKNEDTLTYIQYTAGATRILTDSVSPEQKTYRSRIALNMTRRINDSTTALTSDTLVLNYLYTAQVFQLSSALYNNVQVFTKADGQPNVIQIHK